MKASGSQNGLTPCYNWQRFSSMCWVHCGSQQAGGGHRHKKCPDSEKDSKLLCCNDTVNHGENTDPANYRKCSHVKSEGEKPAATRQCSVNGARSLLPLTAETPLVSALKGPLLWNPAGPASTARSKLKHKLVNAGFPYKVVTIW